MQGQIYGAGRLRRNQVYELTKSSRKQSQWAGDIANFLLSSDESDENQNQYQEEEPRKRESKDKKMTK